MRRSRAVDLLSIALFIVSLTILVIKLGIVNPEFAENMPLPNTYLVSIPDPSSNYTSRSPEIVTSILWDHRGIDTYFETAVLFTAIIGGLYVFEKKMKPTIVSHESTVIVRLATKLVTPVIVVVAVSIALHGHLTPGGGFQGGVVFVIAPLLFIMVFGGREVVIRGLRERLLLTLRSLGVSFISLTGLTLLITGLLIGEPAYLFQNQAKPGYTVLGFPYKLDLPWGYMVFSGTLFILNLLEFVAVAMGFTLVLLILDSHIWG